MLTFTNLDLIYLSMHEIFASISRLQGPSWSHNAVVVINQQGTKGHYGPSNIELTKVSDPGKDLKISEFNPLDLDFVFS